MQDASGGNPAGTVDGGTGGGGGASGTDARNPAGGDDGGVARLDASDGVDAPQTDRADTRILGDAARPPDGTKGDVPIDAPQNPGDSRNDGGAVDGTPGDAGAFYTLPSERVTLWQPGVTYNGGIPTDRKSCLATPLVPLGNGKDDLPQIQKAIDTCPDNTVVQLGEGTFNLGGASYDYLDAFVRLRRSNITLRGTLKDGKIATTLITPCTYAEGESKQCNTAIVVGTLWLHTDDAKSVDVTVDVAKGSKQVTVKSNPGYQVGELVIVDEETDDSLTWWSPRCSPQCVQDQKTNPDTPCSYPDCRAWFIRSNRPVGQVNEIAAVQGNVITFSAPFHMPYRVGKRAQVTRYLQDGNSYAPTTRVGIEDLKVSGGGGGDGGGNIHIWGSSYCWMKNVEAERSSGTSINFDGTFRCELRDSYVHSTVNATPGGAGYGIGFNAYAADNLVENSISWNFNKVMLMRASGGGNVIGYSYFEDGWIEYDPTYVESGLNASHYATAHMELFEGNRAWNFSSDSTWGNAVFITAFRNHLTGLRGAIPPLNTYKYDYVDGNNKPSSLYYEDLGARVGIAVGENHWWYNFVGNVIGYAGMTPSKPKSPGMGGQDRFVYEEKPGDDGVMPMWSIGIQDNGKQEAKTVSTLLRHGNYDYVSKAAVWDPASPNHALPPSLYMTAAPAFMAGYEWPWVDPVTGQSKTLPAKARFDSMR
jgi:hypothetical protein